MVAGSLSGRPVTSHAVTRAPPPLGTPSSNLWHPSITARTQEEQLDDDPAATGAVGGTSPRGPAR